MEKIVNDKYMKWKTCIENNEFIFIDDDEYDKFTKIYENETEINKICDKKEEIVVNELHITDFIEENDFLEDTKSEYIENVIYLLWFIIFSALFSINMNTNTYENLGSFLKNTNIYEETNIYEPNNDFEDLDFLFF
tara:strand:- start:385 stop:792 length:408 start_codon:yes stop_codon:yes gene_type:complete